MSLITSVQTGGSHSHQTTSEEANFFATDFVTPGVIGILSNTGTVAPMTGGYSVNAQGSPNMTVAISTGIGYVTATPTGQGSQCLRVRNTAIITQTINANATGGTRYDFIYIKVDPDIAINPDAGGDDAATINVSRSTSPTTDNGTPPAFGTLIAVVTVANGATSITNGNIRDARAQAGINPSGASSASSWLAAGYTPNTVAANGNRSYNLTFNSVDLTGFLSPGMRLRATRTTAAPTQCTSLNGTTQFYSRASASLAGMTFTNNFTVSAWIKVSAYSSGGGIASRYNGTSGWYFGMLTSGQIILQGFNAGAANHSEVTSYQSVPLNKWVHVSAQLDMATFTASPTTSYVMIDGVDVPATVTRAGTNPTALIQAGNLEIGSTNSGALPFSGKIAQVAIYSAKVTEANILTTISQSIVGNETSLISAYSFNNSISDLNANANNLSANGSAVATNADSPFSNDTAGVLNYAIVMEASFSTNTTLTVQLPEGSSMPTSGGVSAISYSSQKVPYGFPAQRGKWVITSVNKTDGTGPTVAATFKDLNHKLTIPIGDWNLGLKGVFEIDKAASTAGVVQAGLSTSTSAFTDSRLVVGEYHASNVASIVQMAPAAIPLLDIPTLSNATLYSLILVSQTADSFDGFRGDFADTIVFAECAHL